MKLLRWCKANAMQGVRALQVEYEELPLVLDAAGDCFGTIAYAPQGDNGFGYDPVFFVPELRKTFAQLTPEEKNAISHRGNALRAFAAELKTYLEKN